MRAAGGLRIARKNRADFADVPGCLKGYRKRIAPDELVQEIADASGIRVRDVERAMFDAFHRPRRCRPRTNEPNVICSNQALLDTLAKPPRLSRH